MTIVRLPPATTRPPVQSLRLETPASTRSPSWDLIRRALLSPEPVTTPLKVTVLRSELLTMASWALLPAGPRFRAPLKASLKVLALLNWMICPCSPVEPRNSRPPSIVMVLPEAEEPSRSRLTLKRGLLRPATKPPLKLTLPPARRL